MLGLVAACGMDAPHESQTAQAATVNTYAGTSGGCSTAVVIGLSKQIAEEAGCENPDSFVSFDGAAGITITSNAVLPYLVKGARDDLETVAAHNTLQVNSALRTLAQQYLLYRWYEAGRCGITAAATVGNSNHEGGRAVDLQNYSARISAMSAHGWAHDVAGDPVHFDHTSSPDDRGQDIKAFQTLWNRNNANDLISVDGEYGPQTEARLKASPATGFAIGATCGNRVEGADVVSVDGPDTVAPNAQAHYAITLSNTGQLAWPASTEVVVAGGSDSTVFDPNSWVSASDVGPLGMMVAPGDMYTIGVDVVAPAATEDTPELTVLALEDGGTMFGTINLAFTVSPEGGPDVSSDGGDHADGTSGGCNAGGRSSLALALAPLALAFRRRRR
ncbi:MAG TPA: NBR1-Ig-like domain-containing protein [Kofleriaceae bacterium]|jgi:Synergist-CTERM protein sorting domain-containing protein